MERRTPMKQFNFNDLPTCLENVGNFIAESGFLDERCAGMKSLINGSGSGEIDLGGTNFRINGGRLTIDGVDAIEINANQLSALTCWLLKLQAVRCDNALADALA